MWKTSLHCTTEGNLQFHPLKNISQAYWHPVASARWFGCDLGPEIETRFTISERLQLRRCHTSTVSKARNINQHWIVQIKHCETIVFEAVGCWHRAVEAQRSPGSSLPWKEEAKKLEKIRKDEKGKQVKAMWKHRKSPAPMGPMPCAVPNLSRQCGFTAFTKVYGTSRPSTSTTSTCSTMQHPNCTNPVPIHHFAGRSFWFSMPRVKSWGIFSI